MTVGTVIPRGRIHVVPVPETLVRIEPEWRGFLYFVYEDEVVVVNPRDMKIVRSSQPRLQSVYGGRQGTLWRLLAFYHRQLSRHFRACAWIARDPAMPLPPSPEAFSSPSASA